MTEATTTHDLDTIVAVNDSEAFARGYIKLQIALAAHDRIEKEGGHPYGSSIDFMVIDQNGKRVSYPLPEATCRQIEDDAARAVGTK